MDRVFLDTNVLFSAAWSSDSRLRQLWNHPETTLLTSAVPIEEAKRNLLSKRPSALTALNELLTTVHTVQTPDSRSYRGAVAQIAEKDRPILAAALACKANWFLTGDRKDFGHLMGKRIEGVMIASPRTYLESR